MTSNTPSMSPEAQVQATPPPLSSSNGPGRRPWLEPAVVVAVIGLAVTILGLLLSIVFGIYGMNAHIDALGADLSARMDTLSTRMDALGSDLSARIDDLSTRMDALGSDLSARMDTLSTRMDALGSDLSARMDTLSARMDTLSARMDALGSDLSARIDKVYQLLLPKQL